MRNPGKRLRRNELDLSHFQWIRLKRFYLNFQEKKSPENLQKPKKNCQKNSSEKLSKKEEKSDKNSENEEEKDKKRDNSSYDKGDDDDASDTRAT